ncbi:DUF3558 domain-containing protein [Streptomyces sp. NPDC051320]|uniref:DUF3558 domain-containing protein n=1 Tax=Streptomyces sp. NPDC051320 TaxID=3154644 RepID=UPI003442FDC6
MQRRAYVPSLMLFAALVAGCTSGSGDNSSPDDSKPGETTPAAAPGKYLTLPEPCGASDRGVLKDMFPGAAGLPEEQQEKVYAGTPEPTFDTDRRVGCRWKGGDATTSHRLYVDMERVVSYDNAVSDDDRAKALYADRETAADLPDPATGKPSGKPSGSPSGSPSGTTDEANTSDGSDDATGSDGSADTAGSSGAQTSTALQSRILKGLGSAAYLEDIPSGPGAATPQRTVRVVFRESNVIVTVEYSEQPIGTSEVPAGKDLQVRAQALAHKLAGQIGE